MQHPPSGQSDPPSTVEINEPTSKEVLNDVSSKSRSGEKMYALILMLTTQGFTDIDVYKNFLHPL